MMMMMIATVVVVDALLLLAVVAAVEDELLLFLSKLSILREAYSMLIIYSLREDEVEQEVPGVPRFSPKSLSQCLALLNCKNWFRQSPAWGQKCTTDSSTLYKENHRFWESCLSQLFSVPAEFLPPLWAPHTQPLQGVGNQQDRCQTEQNSVLTTWLKVFESNHETPYKYFRLSSVIFPAM